MRNRAVFHYAGILHDQGNAIINEELKKQGLTGIVPSHGAILMLLMQNGSLSMSGLARRIRRTKSTVTVLISKLEKQGYIRRSSDPDDARTTVVTLTEKGQLAMEGVRKVNERLNSFLETNLSDDEADQLEALLKKAAGCGKNTAETI